VRSLLRDLAFHAVGLVTSVLGFTLWVTGVTVSLSLAITVIGLVATLASFYAFRWFARLERQRAALVLGAPIPERYRRAPAGSGWWERLRVAARDPATWKDFAWTFLGSVLSFALSVAAVTLWGVVIGLITLPVWYVYLPDQAAQLGAYTVTPARPRSRRRASGCCSRPSASCSCARSRCSSWRSWCRCCARAASRSSPRASTCSRARARAPSTRRRASCSGSSATCTTARRRGSSRSR